MEYWLNRIKVLVGVALLIGCLWLVITGQRSIGAGLGQMLLGVAGILALLFVYNKSNQ